MNNSKNEVRRLAERFGINVSRAYEIARRPGFPSIRCGKRIVILWDKLDRWIEGEMQRDKVQGPR